MAQSFEVPGPVRELAARLGQSQPMRRGSLSERYVKCGKPGCGCAEDAKARHGPYYSLTRAVGGRTRSRFLNPQEAQRAREQIETGQQFRRQVEAYWAVCEQWADAQLEAREEEGQAEVKKPHSARLWRTTSPRRLSAWWAGKPRRLWTSRRWKRPYAVRLCASPRGWLSSG